MPEWWNALSTNTSLGAKVGIAGIGFLVIITLLVGAL